MRTIGKLLFETTGIMTQKEIMRRCEYFGEKVSEIVQADGKSISADKLGEILNGVLGKRSRKIQFLSSKEDMINVLKENLQMPEKSASLQVEMARAMAVPKGFGRTTAIIVPNEIMTEEIVNLAPHELEHALKSTFSLSGKLDEKCVPITNLYFKIKQFLFNSTKGFANQNAEYNNIACNMQKMLLGLANVGEKGAVGIKKQDATINGLENFLKVDSKYLHEILRERIYRDIFKYETLEDCKNYRTLLQKTKILKKMLKDESNAYKAGGQNEHKYFEELGLDMKNKSSHSELVSILYKEAYKIINHEQKHIRMNRIKSLMGIKPNLKMEKEFFERFGPKTLSFEEVLDMCAEHTKIALDLIKDCPTCNIAKYILTGKDKRFESILEEVKQICEKQSA